MTHPTRLPLIPAILLFTLTLLTPLQPTLAQSFEFKKGDRVAFIGPTLFDRAQDFAYFETLLQQRFPEKQLTFRTLAWSADEVTLRPRPQSFKTLHQHLKRQKINVIFANYGFNESFKGIKAIPQFEKDYTTFLDNLLKQKFDGKNHPRIVLVSPIGHETLGPPLPNPADSNHRLAAYTKAIQRIAAVKKLPFVNIFTPTLQAMQLKSKEQNFTFNGIHLTNSGYKQFSKILFRQLLNESPPKLNESLRQTVIDKNKNFFRWYRTLNGFYIYGGRARPYGVVNFPGELKRREQLVLNRDQRIRDIAAGKKVPAKIDDSNVPAAPKITGRRPINKWMTPEKELASFRIDPRFKVNCFASEVDFPELACPIQIRWDSKGRLWVSCSTAYPQVEPRQKPNDKLIILEDTNNDGKADKSTVFAEGLHIPLSFEFGNGGVYVSEQPHLIFLKDTDGDGKADFRRKVLTGFGTEDTHHALHDFTWSPDGDLIFRESIFHHSQVETPYGPVRVRESGFFRYRPATQKLTAFGSYRSTNPWGLTFDQWGQHQGSHPVFATAVHALNAPYPLIHVPAGNYIRAYSGTCGQEFVYNNHFPKEMQGKFIRVRYKPTQTIEIQDWIEKDSHYVEKKTGTLIASSNLSFIPVDVRFGPRGALYICDWYNPVKGHMQYSLRDTRRDKTSGRIWRVVARDRPLLQPTPIHNASISQLLDTLKKYEYRIRYWAKRELRERDPARVKKALDTWLANLDKKHPRYEHHRLEALWMYRNIRAVNIPLLRDILQSKNHNARAAATRQLRYWHKQLKDPIPTLKRMVNDKNGLVRLEAVIAASYYQSAAAIPVALQALKHPMDSYLTLALRMTLDSMRPIWQADPKLRTNHHLLHFMVQSEPKARRRRPKPKRDKKAIAFDKLNPKVIKIKTIPERMLFDITEFKVKPNQPIKLILDNVDATPHNLVIVSPGAATEVGLAANDMARGPFEEAMKKHFVPKSKKVLHWTRMLKPNEQQTLRFRAPKKPGVYPYICSFPGHWLVMKGNMIVEK